MSQTEKEVVDPFIGLPSIFRDVVDPYDYSGRFDVSRPFLFDEWVVATDGRILVRTPIADLPIGIITPLIQAEDNDQAESGNGDKWKPKPPNAAPACEAFKAEYEPEVVLIPNSIDIREQCPECGGNGVSEGDACWNCEGTGKASKNDSVEIVPGVHLGRAYLILLRKHGAWLKVPKGIQGHCDKAVYFAGFGYEGLLMPRIPELAEARKPVAVPEALAQS